MRISALKSLVGGLGAKKDRDAGLLGVVQAEIAALDRERDALEASLASAYRELDPQSVVEQTTLEKWRAATEERIRDIAMKRVELAEIASGRRDALKRSNGEVEAVKLLMRAAARKR